MEYDLTQRVGDGNLFSLLTPPIALIVFVLRPCCLHGLPILTELHHQSTMQMCEFGCEILINVNHLNYLN